MQKYEYLLVLLITVIPTLLLSIFHPRNSLRKYWLPLVLAILVSSVPFIIWDIYATNAGHWQFNPKFVTGYYFINLPVEEVGFFFAVPFSCLFLWQVILEFKDWKSFWNDLFFK
jgi:lycopene cyclase domain-containing protein